MYFRRAVFVLVAVFTAALYFGCGGSGGGAAATTETEDEGEVTVTGASALTFTKATVYSPTQDSFRAGAAALAVSTSGVANVVTMTSYFDSSDSDNDSNSGFFYSSSISNASASEVVAPALSAGAAELIMSDLVEGSFPTTSYQGRREVTIDIGPLGRCYIGAWIDYNNPEVGFYVSDDCSDPSQTVWEGPFIVSDEIRGEHTWLDIQVDASDTLHMLWGGMNVTGSSNTSDVLYDQCVYDSQRDVYRCGSDICLTCRVDTGEGAYDLSLEIYGDTGPTQRVHAFWHHGADGFGKVYTSRSTNGGSSFSVPTSFNEFEGLTPRSAIHSNGDLSGVFSGNGAFKFFKSTNGGASYVESTIHNDSAGDPGIYVDDNDDIHVVGYDGQSAENTIAYFKSTNGGTSWSNIVLLPNVTHYTGEASVAPAITGYQDEIYVVFMSGPDVAYVRSPDRGASWLAPVVVASGSSSSDNGLHISQSSPAYATADGLFIVFDSSYEAGLFSGCVEGVCESVAPGPIQRKHPTMFAINATTYGLVWSDNRDGRNKLYFASGTFGSGISGTGSAITAGTGNIHNEITASVASDGTIHLLWKVSLGVGMNGDNIYYSYSLNSGTSWSTPVLVAGGEGVDQGSVVAGSDGTVHFVWSSGSDEALSIYYRNYSSGSWTDATDIGSSFSTNVNMLGKNALAVDSSDTVYLTYAGGSITSLAETTFDTGIYVISKTSSGWGTPVLVAEGYGAIDGSVENDFLMSESPHIVIDSNDIITVGWTKAIFDDGIAIDVSGNGIYTSRSADSGGTWSTAELVTDAVSSGTGLAALLMQMVVDGSDNVWMIYLLGTGADEANVEMAAYIAVGE